MIVNIYRAWTSYFRIAYRKKKDKQATIAFKKDETVPRDDVYKSSTVSVPSGAPASSLSWPPARRRAGVAKPINSGKLLKPGGPSQAAVKVCDLLFRHAHFN